MVALLTTVVHVHHLAHGYQVIQLHITIMPGSKVLAQEVLGATLEATHALIGITRIPTVHGTTVTQAQEAHGATLRLVIHPLAVPAAVGSLEEADLVVAVVVADTLAAADTEDDKNIRSSLSTQFNFT